MGRCIGLTASLGVLEERKSLAPAGIRTSDLPARGLVTILTTICGLSTLSEVKNNSDMTVMLSKLISAIKVSCKCTISVFSWVF